MSVGSVDAIERSVHKTNEWVNDVASELREDREDAWRELKAYVQTLRDQLTVEEAAHLSAQLPLVLRGAFYEGFDPTHQPAKQRRPEQFLGDVAERAQMGNPSEAARVAEAGTRVLKRHITEGEFDDVLAQLPSEVRGMLQHAV
jgi:uncharacterized protein (DUF2267 family)